MPARVLRAAMTLFVELDSLDDQEVMLPHLGLSPNAFLAMQMKDAALQAKNDAVRDCLSGVRL